MRGILLFCLAVAAMAHETDVPFEPKKPEKPVRYCTAAKQWVE